MQKIKLNIAGMTCVNCSNAIERVAKKIEGVSFAKVNFANGLGEFEVSNAQVQALLENKIKKLGYDIAFDADEFEQKRKRHIASLRDRFIAAIVISAVIMVLEMFGEPSFIINLAMILLALFVLCFSGRSFYVHAWGAVRNKNYDMNVLVALGTASAFLYSLFVFLFPDFLPSDLRNMYVSGSAMIISFVLLGKYLEERSKAKAGDYLKTLLKISPKTALVIKPDGQNIQVDINELNIGDIVVVKSGYNIPCDGVIVQGGAEIDTSMLTGESLPVYRAVGDNVFAGTLNTNGYLSIKTAKKPTQTLLSQIVALLSDASTKKMPISRLADRVANIFVPSVILISIATFLVWYLVGKNFDYAISNAICVLIISCPCALGLATPIGIISALARGAKGGILIKNPEVLEIIKDVKFAVFDKTGTLSKGKIAVKKHSLSEHHLSLVACVENLSEHLISKAVVEYAKQNNIKIKKLTGNFKTIVGHGVAYYDDENSVIVGNEKLLRDEGIEIDAQQRAEMAEIVKDGSGIILVAIDQKFAGFITLGDELRDESVHVISTLKEHGIKTVMLSGDNESVVSASALALGVDEYYANALPSDKFELISQLGKQGRVIFVGDGINDSPSLKQADVGIAMNSGSDIAKGAGDIVLVKNDLRSVLYVIELGKSTMRTIKENLFWAFVYNIICIPIAAGVLYPVFGLLLNPIYGAIAMCFSSVTVVLNSIRLRFLKFRG
ncbi:copper-translocating P-type ATPase [Campylobacter sp. RM9344]|uniref:Copper-transporting ATPase n=1 Tax=Campylobacter californiensis TaxID=1032243 RepID=A0AAW3ZUY4_9BACT|nr:MULTISPECIES: heavy metal translocating P-type ATPase [unclassified Campylobacter]MBE2984705.1 copper-translocating P-type ATPase [Campylobacter sp. RM6883]MBE2994621.1 copper-translocating P-type ATPase [Campylobacter sp. RM6913]MBE3029147.1 copper-translocating P-type ATPase [Campylobacter sp. RM9344]MBE3608138.1 copper-translocating P-type ATPase [Campylobacter sp. RM9337]QCD50429.1 copper-translocating P-type ATPase [Campylobacter sp. RM6914]